MMEFFVKTVDELKHWEEKELEKERKKERLSICFKKKNMMLSSNISKTSSIT